jgi:glycosyltransferase involved in cell wall biosynthesis
MSGVSIIIRSHDGASRLPAALAHLKAQAPASVPWEVLLVDHASRDDTADVARSWWHDGPAPLRVIHEAKPGLQSADERGLKEANYDLVGFVNDDNWIAPDWIQTAHDVLTSEASLGAVGSVCEPIFEIPAPEWFDEFHSLYSLFTDSDLDLLQKSPDYLQRPGLCIRRQVYTRLIQGGFRSVAADRAGERLAGSGETELTLAIRLSGWKIRVERGLRLKRFISADHLRWEYVRRLQRSCAASQALLDAYSDHNLSMRLNLKPRLGQLWWCQVGRCLLKLIKQPNSVLVATTSKGEQRRDVIEVERLFGRMLGMLYLRGAYRETRRHVRYAPWRLRHPEEYLRRPRAAHA